MRATIGLAKLVRDRQPKLYDYLYQLRSKQKVQEQIRLLQPLVHISGRFSAARNYLAVVLPLAWHPRNRNALIVCDLQSDPTPLLNLDTENLRRLLYTRREQLAEGELPVPLKLLHINRCPVVAPLGVLREEDKQRLQLDMHEVQTRAAQLRDSQATWQEKIQALYASEDFTPSEDPEQQLYDGFIGDRDRRLCEQVRVSEPQLLGREQWPFDDQRLPELLFRYRARNFPDTLTLAEQQRWQTFCQQRLSAPEWGAPNTLAAFEAAVQQAWPTASEAQRTLLQQWREHAQQLGQRYQVPVL